MFLSYEDIEDIATSALRDFRMKTGIDTIFTPIDQFAKDYMGLRIAFADFGDKDILGLTAYADTIYAIESKGVTHEIKIHAGDVLLDYCFIKSPEHVRSMCGRRRFTLAHECAHQLLFQMLSDEEKAKFMNMYSTRRAYSLRALKSKEDWNEWQANALGAAILMPAAEVMETAYHFTHGRKLVSYDGKFNLPDDLAMEHICGTFAVSKSAMAIRLEQLGLCVRHPRSEFFDPTEVIA